MKARRFLPTLFSTASLVAALWLLTSCGVLKPDGVMGDILSGKANAKSARYLDEAPATPAACAYMNCAAVHAADERWWSRLSFWRTPQPDCHDARGAVCVPWPDWSDAWAMIRSG